MHENEVGCIGHGELGELAHYYFSNDSEYEIVAFTLDAEYIHEETLFGIPIVGFHEVALKYPPQSHRFFVALGYSKLNEIRKKKYLEAKALGYKLVSYVSSRATLLNKEIIGENCFILENNTIQPFVSIGNNVTLWSGNHIGHHSIINDHTFIASHVVVSGGVEIGEQCFIGVNATLRDHIKIGNKCVIGAGALILTNTESEGIYMGEATKRANIPSNRLRNI